MPTNVSPTDYPNIGIDDQSQFDLFNSLPGATYCFPMACVVLCFDSIPLMTLFPVFRLSDRLSVVVNQGVLAR